MSPVRFLQNTTLPAPIIATLITSDTSPPPPRPRQLDHVNRVELAAVVLGELLHESGERGGIVFLFRAEEPDRLDFHRVFAVEGPDVGQDLVVVLEHAVRDEDHPVGLALKGPVETRNWR